MVSLLLETHKLPRLEDARSQLDAKNMVLTLKPLQKQVVSRIRIENRNFHIMSVLEGRAEEYTSPVSCSLVRLTHQM